MHKKRYIMMDDVFLYHAHTFFLLLMMCVGTKTPMSTSIEHELTKRALESIDNGEESRMTLFQPGGVDVALSPYSIKVKERCHCNEDKETGRWSRSCCHRYYRLDNRYYRRAYKTSGTTGPATGSLPMPPLNSRHPSSKRHPRHRYYRLEATGTTGDTGTAALTRLRPCTKGKAGTTARRAGTTGRAHFCLI